MTQTHNMKTTTNTTTATNSKLSFKFKAIVFAFASLLFGFNAAFSQTTKGVDVIITNAWHSSNVDTMVSNEVCFQNLSFQKDQVNIAVTSSNGSRIELTDQNNK